ncbi:MAG: hypothetical protein II515_00905, partial [Desulfovibrio sp.]|nr:hypothetical protein [Desulfovibrio sp.]
RVWIDSQTEEEIKRGIKEAKPLAEYDNLSESAYLRAKEDYLMGINFSRLLSLRYGDDMASFLHKKFFSIAVGRVMTCVLGMVVRREREIRNFVKTPFYRVTGIVTLSEGFLSTEWQGEDCVDALRAEGVTRGCKGLKGAARMVVRKAGGRGWTGAGPGGTRSQGMPKPKTAEAAYCRSRPLVPDLALSLAGTAFLPRPFQKSLRGQPCRTPCRLSCH